jgi:hypothetical protein
VLTEVFLKRRFDMKEIIDYYLVEYSKVLDLHNRIRVMIANGWQPFGSPFSVVIEGYWEDGRKLGGGVIYHQAIVKYKEDENVD